MLSFAPLRIRYANFFMKRSGQRMEIIPNMLKKCNNIINWAFGIHIAINMNEDSNQSLNMGNEQKYMKNIRKHPGKTASWYHKAGHAGLHGPAKSGYPELQQREGDRL